MKKYTKIKYLVAFLATFASFSAFSGTPQALLDYFDETGGSYIVRNTANSMVVVTINGKTPIDTCEDLKSLNLTPKYVKNYAYNDGSAPVEAYAFCQ